MNRKTLLVGIVVLVLVAFGAGYLINHKSSTSSGTAQSANAGVNNGKSVDLSGQQLTSLPSSLTNQTDVSSLNISNNQLTTLPEAIKNMTGLRVLNVENNRLESLPPEIGQMSNLTSLDLSNNRLTSLPAELANLTELKTLNLSGYKGPASDIQQLKSKLTDTDIKF